MNVERRPHGRRRAALVILVLGTLAVGGLWAGTAGESRLPVYPAPTFLADPGWRIEPPGEQAALAKLSEADAIAAATASGDLGDGTKLLSEAVNEPRQGRPLATARRLDGCFPR